MLSFGILIVTMPLNILISIHKYISKKKLLYPLIFYHEFIFLNQYSCICSGPNSSIIIKSNLSWIDGFLRQNIFDGIYHFHW